MLKQNLHTHTKYCDGADTPVEMIEEAIRRGFTSLGFSGHAHMPYPQNYAMTPEKTQQYRREITALKETYRDKIQVLCGIEFDLFSVDDLSFYDYVIGSVHTLYRDGVYYECDCSLAMTKKAIAEGYGGDPIAYARAYYENLVTLATEYDFAFVGHFDLVTKYNEKENVFLGREQEYERVALDALEAVAAKKQVFEINTGAISRKCRTTPYPAPFLLREMKRLGCELVLTSDCHDRRYLECEFPTCYQLLRDHGFDHTLYLTSGGWKEIPIP